MLKNVFVSNLTGTVNYTTAAQPTALTAGQVGVYSVATTGALTLITTTPSATQLGLPILVACGTGNGQFKSVTIQPYTTKGYFATAAVASVPNVFVVGYDGATASYALQSGAAGTYDFKVQNLTLGNPPFPTLGSTPFFQTNAAATQIAIAEAIVKDLNAQTLLSNNDVMPQNKFAFAEVLSAVATAAPASTPTATVTNGSTSVTLSGASASIVPGVYIKFGSDTATTAALYKVLAVSGTAVTLDSPYVNANIALGASISGLITGFVATVGSANCGIRITEFGNMFNGSRVLEPQPNKIMNVSCSMNLSGTPVQNNQIVARSYTAGAGTPATGTNPALPGQLLPYTEGSGTYPQIFKSELFAAGYAGFINRSFLPDNFPLYATAGNSYTTLGIEYFAPVRDFTAQGFVAGDTLDLLIALASATGTQYSTLNTIFSTYK